MIKIAERDFQTLATISSTLGTFPAAFIRSIIEDMRDPLEAMADACSLFEKGAKVQAKDLIRRTLSDATDHARETKARS